MGLRKGSVVPHFTALDIKGALFDSRTTIGTKPVVIYFYPKDDTRVCTIQACAFRDQYLDFKELGAEVIGISSDTINSHRKFAERYQLPFILLSDPNKELRKLFGVPNDLLGLLPGRVTYVVDSVGVIRLLFDSMSGAIHVAEALALLKKL